MRDPLLPPLAAIATGILISRFVSFGICELLTVIAAFLVLGMIALWRQARALAGVCCLLGLCFAAIYDAHIAEVAFRSGAHTLVTDNRRHFTSLLRHGVRVLTTAEFVEELRKRR